ncbi:MAG: TonB-dependent receptor [Planctomycetes bacterium]|nr:TonB-dependent receptor [Planctomycetota bacterium]
MFRAPKFLFVIAACPLLFLDPSLAQNAAGPGSPPQSEAEQEPQQPTVLPEVLVTASGGFEQRLEDVPFAASIFDGAELRMRARTMSEALASQPSVMVQKTSYGQSSPYLRGLTGYHNVLLVDGVRLNHSAMRSGPNQYWSTVDLYGIERLELLMGPQGVLYGSDAVGGVVQALGPKAEFLDPAEAGDGDGFRAGGGVYTRWSSAEDSYTLRFEGEMHSRDWSFDVGQTLQGFGDLRGGKDVGTQKNTGYDHQGTDLRLAHRLADEVILSLGVQHDKMEDVPRTHKTVDGLDWHGLKPGSEIYRLHDQTRDLYYLRGEWENGGGWADAAQITLSLHRHEETRDRMKGDAAGLPDGGDYQGFNLDDLGLTARFEANGAWDDRWSYGFEIHRESADSFKRKYDASGAYTSTSLQGPIAADATYTTLAAYVQDEIFVGDHWSVIPGLRVSRIDVDVDRVEDPITGLPTAFSRDWNSAVGSLRTLWRRDECLMAYAGLSQGFRAPSLYDLTSLDETSVVETPDFDLDPEHFMQFEVGGRGRSGGWHWSTSAYQTWIDDMIVRSPENATGGDVIKHNGDGWIHGLEGMVAYEWSSEIQTELWGSWMNGRVDQLLPAPGSTEVRRPIDRLMPMQARLLTRYQPNGAAWWSEAYVWAVDGQYDLSLRDERDSGRIPDTDGDGFADGTPGYTIFGVRGGRHLRKGAMLTIALENIGNVDYHVHGSGVNGSGLNLILGLDLRF